MTEIRSAIIDGRTCRWRLLGTGPPLVLVHGLAGSWRWWRPLLPALGRDHTVHALDLPGFGGFPRVRPFDLEQAVEWVADWFVAAGVAQADVIGHSLGGLVAARLAGRRPELVRRLVLVAPAGVPGQGPLELTRPLARAVLASSPRFLALLARDTVRSGPVTIATAVLELLAADVRIDLAAVQAPTLVVVGRNDPLVPPAHAAELAEVLPHAVVRELESGHVPMTERPHELTRELLAFLHADA